MITSKPECPSFFEERNQGAVNVAGHEGLHPTEKLAADEDGGDGLVGPGKLVEDGSDVGAICLLVELHHGRANAQTEEEVLDHGGHAAVAHAEHHHSVARHQVVHRLVGSHLVKPKR